MCREVVTLLADRIERIESADEVRAVALELLHKYESAEQSSIGEFHGDVQQGLDDLAAEVAAYRRRIGFSESSDQKDSSWLLTVGNALMMFTGSLPAQSCWCCGAKVERRELGDPWEGRMDGYCYACALNRCDCYPETCPAKSFDQQEPK
jgi:hypothetical protein